MVKAEIRKTANGVTLFIDGKPTYPIIHWAVYPYDDSWAGRETTEMFSEVGVHLHHLYLFDIGRYVKTEKTNGGILYLQDETGFKYDFKLLETELSRLLEADEDSLIMLRIFFEMGGVHHIRSIKDRIASSWKDWWRERNPQELEITSGGGRYSQSYASRSWLQLCQDFLTKLISFLQRSELGQRVFAIIPGAGHTGEWVKESAMEDEASDYSEVMRQAFAMWLMQKYGSLERLRKSWRDPYVHFNKVEIPSPEEMFSSDTFHFRTPDKSCRVIDYFHFLSDLVADDIIALCRTIKEVGEDNILAGVFYGYLTELVWCNWFFDQGEGRRYTAYQRSGHLSLSKVLSSPYVDFIVSPYSYGYRGIGGDSAPMTLVESVRLHGKLYFLEDDTRTHLFPPGSKYGRARDMSETLSYMLRTFSSALTRNCGLWYADWKSIGRRGPYQDSEIMNLISKLREVGEKSIKLDRKPIGEVAVIVNEKSFIYEQPTRNLDYPLIYLQKLWGFPRAGAPYDLYLLKDLEEISESYKLFIFLNAYYLSDAERDLVKRTVRRGGKISLWLFGAGMINDDISEENMAEVTGIKFKIDWTEWNVRLAVTDCDHPVTQDLAKPISFGTDMEVGPIPYVDDEDADILGYIVYSRGMCVPGFAYKNFGDWSSIYIGAPNIPPSLLRSIYRFAGIHIYVDSSDVLYVNRNFLALHAVTGGVKKFHLREKRRIVNAISSEVVAESREFQDLFRTGETKLYYIGEQDWKSL
ncbi:MAG TPA: hypothetical protein ENF41_03825 [Candidatus Bathyarchaeota archaeon]|nr:hypothetical protein [Candidatus Bathyarchaeota archaeon]